MKLEAVDKKNTALICVATVRDMMDNRILVHFDGWDDIYDYWADPTSPYIHPVGWCDQYGHDLTSPSGKLIKKNYYQNSRVCYRLSNSRKLHLGKIPERDQVSCSSS